jgi:hypothetical protein
MIVLLVLSSYVWLGSLSLVIRLGGRCVSISQVWFFASVIFLFQIFASLSLIGLIASGLENSAIILSNFIISSLFLFSSYSELFAFIRQKYLLFRKKPHNGETFYFVFLFILLFLEFSFFAAKSYFFPNYVWDEMVYHLHPVVEWHRAKQILFSIPSPSGWVNSEVLGSKRMVYWLFTFIGNDTFINITQTFSALILCLATFRLMRNLGTTATYAMLSVFAILNLPLVIIQATTNQEHLTLAAYTLSMVSLTYEKFHSRVFHLIVIMMSIALLLSCKTSAVLHFIAFLPFLILSVYHKGEMFSLGQEKKFLTLGFLFLGLVVTVLVKTNISSLILSTLSGTLTGSDGHFSIVAAFSFYGNIFQKNVAAFPSRVLDTGFSFYNADSDSISSFGALFPSIGMFGIVAAIINLLKGKVYDIKNSMLIYCLLLFCIYFSFYFSPWNYRLLLFFPIFSLILGFYFIEKKFSNPLMVFIFTLIFSFFNFFSSSISEYSDPRTMRDFVTSLNPEERSTSSFYQNLKSDSWIFLNEYLEKDQAIAYYASADAWIYPYFGTSWDRKISLLPSESIRWELNDSISISNSTLDELKLRGFGILHLRKENMQQFISEVNNEVLIPVADGVFIIK